MHKYHNTYLVKIVVERVKGRGGREGGCVAQSKKSNASVKQKKIFLMQAALAVPLLHDQSMHDYMQMRILVEYSLSLST